MSSTNRSQARDSHISDYYVTPIEPIIEFFTKANEVIPNFKTTMQNGIILDPCAGGNLQESNLNGITEIEHQMSYPTAINITYGNDKIYTSDIRQNSLAKWKLDYLQTQLNPNTKPNVIISNPPFKNAKEFIEKSLTEVADFGFVVYLLRLNFFGSKERKSFFDANMPNYVFVHHKRISFTEKKDQNGNIIFNKDGSAQKGSTDSVEYMHSVWQKGNKTNYTKLYLI